jgi:hypothetical protein
VVFKRRGTRRLYFQAKTETGYPHGIAFPGALRYGALCCTLAGHHS